MKIKIWKIPFCYTMLKAVREVTPFIIEEKGYIELDDFDEDECWHLCNWSCWSEDKPVNLFSDLEVANSDIIFHNPNENKYYLAMPIGWKVEDSLENIIDYCNSLEK